MSSDEHDDEWIRSSQAIDDRAGCHVGCHALREDDLIGDTRDEGWPANLHIAWAKVYRAEWDTTPACYVAAGIVGWGRSRRLAKIEDPACAFTSYVGIQHFDPARWNLPCAPVAKYFASLFVRGRTVGLRTYATMSDALAAVRTFHERLGSCLGSCLD
jgi:hypothetical protein